MPDLTKTFAVADPLHMDGDAFEVAERACSQAAAVAGILATCVEGAATMARNAELSRNLQETPTNARAEEWDKTIQQRKLLAAHDAAVKVASTMTQLSAAAGFNPKAPLPKED